MPTIAEVRSKYPQYKGISDQELADRLHARFYSDIPKDDFYGRIGLRAASAPPPAAAPAEPTLTPRQRAIAAEREAAASSLTEREKLADSPLFKVMEATAAINPLRALTGDLMSRERYLDIIRDQTTGTKERLAREEAYIRRTGSDPERLTMLERIREGAKDIPRAAIEGFGRAASVAGAFDEPGERLARGVEERATGLAEAIGLKPDERAEFDPLQRNIQKLTSGLGSTVPFVATEVVGRKLQPVIKGAGAVARWAQVALGSGAGASEQRRSIEEYEAETGEKVDQVTRSLAQAAGGAVGLTEILPIASMVSRLPPSVRGQAFSGAASLLKRIGAGEVSQSAGMATLREGIEALERRALGRVALSAAEEGAQEAGSQAAQNVIGAVGYNPEQDIGEGVGEAALIGGLVGGAIRGGTEAVTGAPTLAAPEAVVVPPSDTEIVVNGQRRPDLEARVARSDEVIEGEVIQPKPARPAESETTVTVDGQRRPDIEAALIEALERRALGRVALSEARIARPEEVIEGEVIRPKPIRPANSETTVTMDGQRRPDIEAALFAEPAISEDVTEPPVPEVMEDIIAEPVVEAVEPVAATIPRPQSSRFLSNVVLYDRAPEVSRRRADSGELKSGEATYGPGVRVREIAVRNAADQMDDIRPLYHGTNISGAKGLVGATLGGERRHEGVYTSPDQDLALGQKGNDFVLEFDPRYVNGFFPESLQNATASAVSGGPAEFVVNKTLKPSLRAITARTPAKLEAIKNSVRGIERVFDFDNPTSLPNGSLRVSRIKPLPEDAVVSETQETQSDSSALPEATPSERNVAPEPTVEAVAEPTPEPIDVTDAAPPAEPPAAPPAEPPATPPPAAPTPATPATPIKLGKETLADKFVRITANRMRRLGYVEEQIEQATGSAIPRDQRPSEKAALFEGRATPRIDELQRDNFQPLLDTITQEGLTANEVDLYLLARAAPARNAKVAERNPAMPDGGSGMTNADAQAYMDMFTAEGKTPALERMAEKFDAMTERTRQTLVEYDMITPDQASALVASEPQYAPFKGRALDGDTTQSEEDVSGAFMSPGFTITPREYKPVKGRSTLPFSPLATAMADAQAAIIRGETNRYRKTFLDMVRNNPSEYWQVFTEENPDVDRVFDSRTGKVSERPVNMRALPDKYLIVKEGGTPQYIKINDPLLMRALTNASAKEWGAVNRVLGATIGAVTRAMSKLYTTLNPEFVVTNFSRDIQAAVFNILAEQGRADGRIVGENIVKGVAKDIGNWKNWRDLFRSTFNHTANTPEQQAMNALFLQAKEDGAFTGWVQRESPELHMEKIQQTIADATAVGAAKTLAGVKKGVAKTIEAIEDVNSVFENSIRLAVYKNALEVLGDRDQAASMARNMTVDFNRKGELGPTLNSLYAFFNAAVQGNTQLLRSLTNVKGGKITLAQKAALGMVAIGFMRSLYNAAFADDDEDGKSFYDKIPDHVKQRNMVFMNPVDNRSYGLIPLPYGYSFFDNIGATVADVMRGQKDATAAGGFLFGGILNNFSPIPVNTQTAENLLSSFAPTAFKPLVDLGLNRNFFGSEIFNEPFVRGEALSANPRYNTPQVYKDITAWMNDATGGQGRVKGAVDVPAEALKYAVEQYIGGLGNLIFQSIDVGTKAATGRDVELGQIPFVRRLVGEPSKQADLGDYYDRINAIGPIERQLKDADPKERAALIKDHPVETDAAVIAARKQAMRVAKNINKQKRAILESDMDWIARNKELDRLNELQRQAYRRFNTVYNRVEKAEK